MYQEDVKRSSVSEAGIALEILDSITEVVYLDDEIKRMIEEKSLCYNTEVPLTEENMKYCFEILQEKKFTLDLRKRI